MNQKGMTITELVVVLLIIVGMGLAAIPAFHYLKAVSRKRDFLQTVGMIESGLAELKVKQMLLEQDRLTPESLDNNPSSFTCSQCFESVLEKGLSNNLWFKKDEHTYLYSTNGNQGVEEAFYKEPGDFQLSYLPLEGKVVHSQF